MIKVISIEPNQYGHASIAYRRGDKLTIFDAVG